MALFEVPFDSTNNRDRIQAWIYTPTTRPRGVVQLIHGLGEHSRRYLHLISALLDAGFVVAADDHAGHGRTAMTSGIWQDTGQDGVSVVVEDEQRLRQIVNKRFEGLPYIVFGHSWGSMIARVLASRHPEGLAGLALCGVVAQMRGLDNPDLLRDLEAAIAERGGEALDSDGIFGAAFEGALDRFEDACRPTDWVALDRGIVEDHAVDPFNNFGAPMTLRFARDFVALYAQANDPSWIDPLPRDLPVLILAGDQDPVANYGEGAYHVANSLWGAGMRQVRTRVYTAVRHEIHNEPTTRADVEAEVVAFAERCLP